MATGVVLSQRRRQTLGRLRRRKTRAREGAVLVEGVRAVREAWGARADVRFAVASPRVHAVDGGDALVLALREGGVDLVEVDDTELAELADTEHPQGILAVCAEPALPTPMFVTGGRYLVLDGVQDPGNAGTLVRAAAAFGVDGVVALDGTVDLWSAKAVRASTGLGFRVPVTHAPWSDVQDALTESGVPVLVAAADGPAVQGGASDAGWALVVGNEGAGARGEIREGASGVVSIAMPGPAESLNVGMAGSILLYALTVGRAPSE